MLYGSLLEPNQLAFLSLFRQVLQNDELGAFEQGFNYRCFREAHDSAHACLPGEACTGFFFLHSGGIEELTPVHFFKLERRANKNTQSVVLLRLASLADVLSYYPWYIFPVKPYFTHPISGAFCLVHLNYQYSCNGRMFDGSVLDHKVEGLTGCFPVCSCRGHYCEGECVGGRFHANSFHKLLHRAQGEILRFFLTGASPYPCCSVEDIAFVHGVVGLSRNSH